MTDESTVKGGGRIANESLAEFYKLKALENLHLRLQVHMNRAFVTDPSDKNYNRLRRCLISALACIRGVDERDAEKEEVSSSEYQGCMDSSDCKPGWICKKGVCVEGPIQEG